MLQDLIRIRPQSQKNYHAQWFELATVVSNPKAKAQHYFQWALIHHARKKPAEAYKYYERAIQHHRHPLYIRQMALLHHEMGFFRDALKYLRTAFELEHAALQKKQQELEQYKKQAVSITWNGSADYCTSITQFAAALFIQNTTSF